MNEKKMVRRSSVIALGIICIVLLVGLGGAVLYTVTLLDDKNKQIASKDSQISQLNATISNLNAYYGEHSLVVHIYASDPSDAVPRTWDVVFDRAMPPLAVGGDHVGSDVDETHNSGDIMTFTWNLVGGAHYLTFAVTQTGGTNYGVYSGTITINGNTYNFSGLDANHTVTINFTVPLS